MANNNTQYPARNMTFGDPNQPGYLTIKNGAIDIQAPDGSYIVKNGQFQGLSGTFYVALTSGGSPTTKLTFVNGLLVSAQ